MRIERDVQVCDLALPKRLREGDAQRSRDENQELVT